MTRRRLVAFFSISIAALLGTTSIAQAQRQVLHCCWNSGAWEVFIALESTIAGTRLCLFNRNQQRIGCARAAVVYDSGMNCWARETVTEISGSRWSVCTNSKGGKLYLMQVAHSASGDKQMPYCRARNF